MKESIKLHLLIVVAMSCFLASLAFASDVDKRAKTFTVGKGARLEISISGGDIIISPWSKDEIYVSAEDLDEEDLDKVEMTQSGNTVRVSYKPRWGSSSSGRFRFNVPVQCDGEWRTAGGDIEVTGALSGSVRGSTAGGDIKLASLSGKVDMSTSGGDVSTGNIDGTAILKTSGGSISVGTISGEAEVKTSGGDITVASAGKILRASTSGGDISVGDIGGDAMLSTSGGDVRAGKVSGHATMKTAGGEIILKGASGSAEVKTAGGDIHLEDISGSIQAKTAGGNVYAELIPSGKGESRLGTAGGDVKLLLPENAKASIEARIRLRMEGRKREKYEIRSDFKPDSYEQSDDEIFARYTLNGGGETITLETVNGYIDIKKSSRK